MKQSDKAFASEVQRIDTLMAKWGILLGNLGGNRARRRSLATTLAMEYGKLVTDIAFKSFLDEGKLQGVKMVHSWMINILENEGERKAYFPEIIKTSQGSPSTLKGEEKRTPGDVNLNPGTKEYLQKQADTCGTTLSEETFRARRGFMWCRCWGDRWDIKRIAEEQDISVEQCRKEISDEMMVQWDMTLEEWEAKQKAAEKHPKTDEVTYTTKSRSEIIAEVEDKWELKP